MHTDTTEFVRRTREVTETRAWPRLLELGLYAFASFAGSLAYALFVLAHTVPNVFWDQWEQAKLIIASFTHTLTFSNLWSQHNLNRMLIPNIIEVIYAHLLRSEAFPAVVTALVLYTGSYLALIMFILRHSSGLSRLFAFLSASALMLSTIFEEDSLWSFQLAWFIVIVCLILAGIAAASCKPKVALPLVIGLSLIATFSSLQGIIVLPAIALIFLANRNWRATPILLTIWTSELALYFHGLNLSNTGGPGISATFHSPILAAKYFLVIVGSIFGSIGLGPLGFRPVELAGLLLIILALTAIMIATRWFLDGRAIPALSLIGASLFAYGLVFAAMTTVGRTGFGLAEAESSRYTLNTLFIPVGTALVLAGLIQQSEQAVKYLQAISGVLLGLTLIAASIGDPVMLTQADLFHQEMLRSIALTANWESAPSAEVSTLVYPNVQVFKIRAAQLQRFQLDGFGGAVFSFLRLEGPTPAVPSTRPLGLPLKHPLPKFYAAWDTLSAVYFQRSDLQSAFPLGMPVNRRDCVLAKWATRSAQGGSDSSRTLLRPFAQTFQEMQSMLCK